jgi:hypothetical protein
MNLLINVCFVFLTYSRICSQSLSKGQGEEAKDEILHRYCDFPELMRAEEKNLSFKKAIQVKICG